MVIVTEALKSSPPAVANGQNAVFSIKLMTDETLESVTVNYDLPPSGSAVFVENNSRTITKAATVFSFATLVERSYALQNATPGSTIAVTATVQQSGATSSGLVVILA